jgi:hypothetical protein
MMDKRGRDVEEEREGRRGKERRRRERRRGGEEGEFDLVPINLHMLIIEILYNRLATHRLSHTLDLVGFHFPVGRLKITHFLTSF